MCQCLSALRSGLLHPKLHPTNNPSFPLKPNPEASIIIVVLLKTSSTALAACTQSDEVVKPSAESVFSAAPLRVSPSHIETTCLPVWVVTIPVVTTCSLPHMRLSLHAVESTQGTQLQKVEGAHGKSVGK